MIVVCYTSTNSPNKYDATGAFIPETQKFVGFHRANSDHEVVMYPIDCSVSRPKRRAQVLAALKNHDEIEMFVYFGHGLERSIQIGFDTSCVSLLADPLKEKGCKTVVLYACSVSGNVKAGFAKALAEKSGARVYGHTVEGHAVWNPFVRYFEPDGSCAWVVDPKAPEFSKWRALLKTDVAYDLPFLTQEQIAKMLEDPK